MPTNFIQNAASAAGVTLARQARSADVLTLIRKLKPLNCEKNLIRIGGDGDGGYLLPDDLHGIEYCFSPGVGATAQFENDLADRNIKCFLADYSVEAPPLRRPEIIFDKKFLGANDTATSFTLQSWIDQYLKNYHQDLLLQMDIEGFEYEVIISTPVDVLSKFRIMVIEFHYLDKIFDPFVHTLYKSCFERLLQSFHVAHIHPNNCCGSVKKGNIEVPKIMEFTFYNKRRVRHTEPEDAFPHSLDKDNVEKNDSLPLPKCWYG